MSIVVDCDAHVMEPADLWQRYLEPKFRDRAIRVVEENGVEKLIIGEQVVLEQRLAALGGTHLDRALLFAGGVYKYADGCPLASYDPHARARMQDEWGVDYGVLFPTIGILPFPIDDVALSSAYCRAYNRWQTEFFQTVPKRVVPIAVVNWHDVDEAARELASCLQRGFKGVFVPPETIGGKRPADAHFDPIWRLCEAAGVPGCLHVIVRFRGAAIPFQAWHDTMPGPLFGFGLGGTGQLIPALTSIVVDGLFVRYPKLKIVSVEAGCGYAAYLMDRLDEKYQFFKQMVALPEKPSEYIRRNCWFVAEPEERTIDAMLDLVGEDRILWGSDFPHVDATLDAPRLIRQSVAHLTPARRAMVMGENAVKVFGL